MTNRYSPSNKVNIPLFALLFVLTTGIVGFCSGLFAMVGMWLFPPFSGMVLVVLVGALSYWIYFYSIRISHNRNKKLTSIFFFISSLLVAYYHMCTVVATIRILGGDSIAVNPMIYIDNMGALLYGSLYQMIQPGIVFSAFFSAGIPWIIYFILIVFSSVFFPQIAVKACLRPYSEEYRRWMDKVPSTGKIDQLNIEGISLLERAFQTGNIRTIMEYPKCTRNMPQKYAQLVFYKIGTKQTGYVSIENIFHFKIGSSEHDPDAVRRKEVVPPYMLGIEQAAFLEKTINSTASMMNFPENNTFVLKKI